MKNNNQIRPQVYENQSIKSNVKENKEISHEDLTWFSVKPTSTDGNKQKIFIINQQTTITQMHLKITSQPPTEYTQLHSSILEEWCTEIYAPALKRNIMIVIYEIIKTER